MAASALAVSQWLHGSTARARRPLRQAQGKHLSTAGKMPALQLLVMDFVVAGFAAGAAVVEAVFPEADIELALAEAAVLLAFAAFFNLLALAATDFGLGRHVETLALRGQVGNIPLVTCGFRSCMLLHFWEHGTLGMNATERRVPRLRFGCRLTTLGMTVIGGWSVGSPKPEPVFPRLTPEKTA